MINDGSILSFPYLTSDAAVHGVVAAVVRPWGDLVQQDRAIPKQEHLDTDDTEKMGEAAIKYHFS